jgi:hypothetical protein
MAGEKADDTDFVFEADPSEEEEEQPTEEIKEETPEGISDLRRQLAEMRAEKAAAEAKAQAAQLEAHNARIDVDDTNLQLIGSAIDKVSGDLTTLKQQYAYAAQQGDFEQMAEINGLIAENNSNLQQLKNGRDALTNKPKPTAPVLDPVAAFTAQLSKPSADWLREHPQFVTDARLNRKMIVAHEDTVEQGIKPDTPEYFANLEKIMGLRKAPEPEPDEDFAAKRVSGRDSGPPAAPVSRNGGPGMKSNIVRLTREEREFAEMNGQTPEEYAKAKRDLIKEGRLQ